MESQELDRPRRGGLLLCAVLAALVGPAAARPSSLATLTKIRQIRTLTRDEARRGYPVHVRAVVTYYGAIPDEGLFVQDETAGVWVNLNGKVLRAKAGDLLDLDGVTEQPDFAPQITNAHWRVVGRAPFPKPQPVSYEEMASTREDSQWVEVEGVVHSAAFKDGVLVLGVAAGGGHVMARVTGVHPPIPSWLLDSRVKLRGACGAVFNSNNQLVGVRLYVPGLDQITVVEPAPANPFAAPIVALGSIQSFSPTRTLGHRLHVRGVVTFQEPGKLLYVTDGKNNLQVLTDQQTPVEPGDLVDVLGYPGVADYAPALEDALYRPAGIGRPAQPEAVAPAQLLNDRYDGALVRVEGRVAQATAAPRQTILYVESGDRRFTAVLDRRGRDGLVLPEAGSTVALTGICDLEYDASGHPQYFRILLRGVNDVAVLARPPWWNLRHAAYLLGIGVAVVILGLAWITILDRRVSRQAEIIRRRVEHEAALEKRFAYVARATNDVVWDCDLVTHELWWSEGLKTMFGYASEQVAPTDEWWRERVHPDDREHVISASRRVIEAGEDAWTAEYRFRRADGSYAYVYDRAYVIRDAQGRPVRMIGAMMDLTERKRAEEALRQEKEFVECVINASADGIVAFDRECRYTVWNPAMEKMTGVSKEQTLGRSAFEVFPFLKETGDDELFYRPLAGETGYSGVRPLRATPTGRPGFFEAYYAPLRGASGEVVGGVRIVRDVTDRQRAREELLRAKEAAEAASRAKSEFLANMSHEIRTPMNGILGMTELALETELTAEQQDYLNLVKLSADSLLNVINDVLDFSKIEAGKLDLDVIEFNLHDSLSETVRTLALKAAEKNLELLCDIRPDVPEMVRGDPTRLRQIIVNLVGNAIKFTERGEVMVQVENAAPSTEEGEREEALFLRFRVRDTGIGIPREKQRLIFEPFSQADASTTRRFGGTGLGLTISMRLAEMMGGRISVESEPGQGSEFSFTARLGRAPQAAPPPAAGEPALAGVALLVVDDNSTNRRLLADMLRSWGMRPVLAANADEALQALRQAQEAGRPLRLAISDVHMPDVDGFDLVERIREDGQLEAPAILMLTSAGQRGDAARCRELGVAAYLTKPIRKSELRQALVKVLSGAAARVPAGLVTRHSLRSEQKDPVPLRILLAEDNAVNQALAMRLLEKRGHHVITVTNGREALAALEKHPFDLVLMDVQMPEMDGFEATAAIRARERETGAHVPIVAMTAHAMKGDEERCLAAGMDGYVSKPIQASRLFEIIAQWTAAAPATADAAETVSEPVAREG